MYLFKMTAIFTFCSVPEKLGVLKLEQQPLLPQMTLDTRQLAYISPHKLLVIPDYVRLQQIPALKSGRVHVIII